MTCYVINDPLPPLRTHTNTLNIIEGKHEDAVCRVYTLLAKSLFYPGKNNIDVYLPQYWYSIHTKIWVHYRAIGSKKCRNIYIEVRESKKLLAIEIIFLKSHLHLNLLPRNIRA